MTSPPGPSRPILLLGADGQVGGALAGRLAPLGPLVVATRADADLEQPDALRALVRRVAPAVVINAAAYTAVDDAERDGARCERINAVAPGVIAEEARRLRAPMVHFSTNYVFDGAAERPYDEGAPPAPLNAYGASKLRGEAAVAAATPEHLIFRLSAVYGWRGRNFMLRMLELARSREEIAVVDDQFVAPTRATSIARAVVSALRPVLTATAPFGGFGTYHLCSRGATSWFGFAEALLRLDPRRDEHVVRRLRRTSTADFHAAAQRPRNGLLDSAKAAAVLGIEIGPWDEELRREMARLDLNA